MDDSLYVGEIQYAPVYKHWYYEVVMTELRINRHKIDVPCKEVGVNITAALLLVTLLTDLSLWFMVTPRYM